MLTTLNNYMNEQEKQLFELSAPVCSSLSGDPYAQLEMLETLLRDDDGAAAACCQDLTGSFTALDPELFAALQQAIADFDFDTALEKVALLRAVLDAQT